MWRLDLPITRPLSLNDRDHWAAKASAVQHIRHTTKLLATSKRIPPLGKVSIELHYVPRDKRRRDPINLVATLKAVEDGIVDAGVIPDDTPEFSVPTMPVIDAPDSSAHTSRIYVLVKEQTA